MTEESRAELAARWTDALSTTAYVPLSRRAVEQILRELVDGLFEALLATTFSTGAANEAGRRLVTVQFTGEESLSRTIEVLGHGLPASPELREVDGLTSKVVSLLGAMSAGYAGAMRMRTLDQQETVKIALLKAGQSARRRLRVSEVNFRELFTSSAIGIAISDLDGTLLEVNQALTEIVGRPAAELVGCSVHELFHPGEAAQLKTAYRQLVDGVRQRLRPARQHRLLGKDGETVWAYLAMTLLHDADGNPTRHATMVEDVTELHLIGERLNHQSLHDMLTGLPNHQFFVSTLEGAVGRAAAITLYKIDLDGFSVVNDGLGRQVGDRLLRSVAARLQAVVAGEKATVARFGADEFAILIENSPTSADVDTLAAAINTELAEPIYIDGTGVAVSASIGVVEHRGGAIEPAELLRAAEATLRRVKSGGTRQWALFDPHLDVTERARSRLAAAMPGAWENGEIRLEYQPQVRLEDGAVVGIEALLRWDHPQRGPIAHRECVELAERTGLVLPLGEWLLRRACEQLAAWRAALGEATPVLHVELTAQQSNDPDLVASLRGALENAGLAAADVRLGMPVPALGGESGDVEDNLAALADLGVAIALLEYGAAADAAYLAELPVRAVRVAHRLSRHVRHGDALVARTVPGLLAPARSCTATVIAGDIRTKDEAGWWRSAGADVGQGRFFAPPVAPRGRRDPHVHGQSTINRPRSLACRG